MGHCQCQIENRDYIPIRVVTQLAIEVNLIESVQVIVVESDVDDDDHDFN